jgi:dTDP-4-dehydrorhamnose reductase
MNILLFGKNGQLGSDLQRSLMPLGHVTALNKVSSDYCGDLSDLNGIAKTIAAIKPDVIVNAAAYTAVDKAEGDVAQAMLINSLAPEVMAVEAKRFDVKLIHYSTDYVFDGHGNVPFKETDSTHPLNVYGRSKKAGEDAIGASGCRYLIFRTSWVYGAVGKNFAKTIFELAKARETLNVVNDQIGAPTGADFLADVTAQVIRDRPDVNGLFHLAAAGETSWFDYARLVVETLHGLGVPLTLAQDAIKPIPTKDYPTPAQRPLNSRLDMTRFKETFGITPPQWQNGVTAMLTQLYGK